MDASAYANHVAILREELVRALGCTEPIAVAYASALARAALGTMPERLWVACSGNIIKNVKSVTVPNSGGMRGVEAAAVLGALGGDETRALEVLETIDETDRTRAARLVATGICTVELAESAPKLYVRVRATAHGHVAVARLEGRHTNVTELTCDGTPVSVAGVTAAAADPTTTVEDPRAALSLASIWEFARTADLADIDGIVSAQISTNKAISDEGLRGRWGANIGRTLLASRANDITCRARASAAAGSDARMSGCAMPVVICCGSGNQGITCSLPVLEYAHELWVGHGDLVRAVALSDLTAVHVKYYVGELSAFCGAVSASCGAGAGICMLRGGSFEQFEATVVNTLVNVGGIVCDGAKPSCAAKISAAVDAAILGCDQALSGDNFLPGEGLVGKTPEESIRAMGRVGRVGMQPTDVEILNIMIGKTDV
ncbi:MAG: L-serine ammonia-lyase, iron-sulfur-dependent, subunit alpha [Acidobacteriota bacterium]|nr:L-serine ammonia-lyase, iron-sulfur-dependent, subunit alpha [Acidobacteriota bacterium]